MLRLILAAATLVPFAYSAGVPSFQLIKQVDSSGSDTVAGVAVDAAGNTYIAGSTNSASYPVKSAVQSHTASAGLYRIDGPGSAYTALGLGSATYFAIDPLHPATIYADSKNSLLKSTDGGATFSPLNLPSTQVETITIDPTNDQILYAGTLDQGLLKSTDGGATWAASNGTLHISPSQFPEIWIDPGRPSVLFANLNNNVVRSSDSGATWQMLFGSVTAQSVTFDPANPGVVYVCVNTAGSTSFKSTDYGQTFTPFTAPVPFGAILADPNHPGRLVAAGPTSIYESGDNGATWTSKLDVSPAVNSSLLQADWSNGFLYVPVAGTHVVRIAADLSSFTPVGPPGLGNITGLDVAAGHAYVSAYQTADVFVTKLDVNGNIVYSTYFGGAADDVAVSMAVDRSGNVYVTGTTTSIDFPVSKGAFATTGASFVFKLNPDGTLGYSTYLAPGANAPAAIAVDASGSAYVAGISNGSFPTTPGAYQTTCTSCGVFPTGFAATPHPNLAIITNTGFLAKLDVTGSSLAYGTFIGGAIAFTTPVNSLAVGPDGSAYVGGSNGLFHLNAAGSQLLASIDPRMLPQVIGVAADGSVYVAGGATASSINPFQSTAGAFETTNPAPVALPGQNNASPTVIAKWDPQLGTLLAATYFGPYKAVNSIAFDSSGNVYLGGGTTYAGVPTRTPLQEAFSSSTGFVSELSGDLSTLLFSSYFGDTEFFTVKGAGIGPSGNLILGGATGSPNIYQAGPQNIWVNSVNLAPPPALRIDSIVNAASQQDGAIAAGETIMVKGAGFASDAQLSIGGISVAPVSITNTAITATVPQDLATSTAAEVQVHSQGADSNQVVVQVAITSPGIYSQDGSGAGQGYILLNKDGTLNTPSNPSHPGEPITIYATGVGPVTFSEGYAITQYPVNVFIDGFYCAGIAAALGPVSGFPGDVYRIAVYVPDPARLVEQNPDLKGFTFPPLVGLTMSVNGVYSQPGLSISIAP